MSEQNKPKTPQEAYNDYQEELSFKQIKTMGLKMLKQQAASANTSEKYKAACEAEIKLRGEQREALLKKEAAEAKAQAPVPEVSLD